MKVGVSGAIAITITGGISLYVLLKLYLSKSKMVTETKVNKTSNDDNQTVHSKFSIQKETTTSDIIEDSLKLKKGTKKQNKRKSTETLVNENNNSSTLTYNVNHCVDSIETELVISDLTPQQDLIHNDLNILENCKNCDIISVSVNSSENCLTNQVYLENIGDDCTQEMFIPTYEEVNKDASLISERQTPSELSSFCSSISPISDFTVHSSKIEMSVESENKLISGHVQNAELQKNNHIRFPSGNSCRTETNFHVEESVAAFLKENNQLTFAKPEDRMPRRDEFLRVYNENFVHCVLNVPNQYVGKLLGKRGRFVQKITTETGVSVEIDEILNDGHKKCFIMGLDSKVCKALEMIEKLFPAENFPDMIPVLNDVEIVNTPPKNKVTIDLANPENEGPSINPFPIKVTGISTVNSLYIQFMGHPLYPQLQSIQDSLEKIYSKYPTPNIPFPCAVGSICVGYIFNEWQRCEVLECKESTIIVLLADKGCITEVDPSLLKLALKSVTKMPFFASPVFLNGIQVSGDKILAGNEWLNDTVSKYEMVATLVGRDYRKIPIISLFAVRENNRVGLVNNELIALDFAHFNPTNMICEES